MKFKIERNWSNLKTQKRNLSLLRRSQSSFKSMGADILSEAYNENRIFSGLQQACAIHIFELSQNLQAETQKYTEKQEQMSPKFNLENF